LRIDTPLIALGLAVADNGAQSRQEVHAQQEPESDPV
jgi:hypothetical protein